MFSLLATWSIYKNILKQILPWNTWLAQLVEYATLDTGSWVQPHVGHGAYFKKQKKQKTSPHLLLIFLIFWNNIQQQYIFSLLVSKKHHHPSLPNKDISCTLHSHNSWHLMSTYYVPTTISLMLCNSPWGKCTLQMRKQKWGQVDRNVLKWTVMIAQFFKFSLKKITVHLNELCYVNYISIKPLKKYMSTPEREKEGWRNQATCLITSRKEMAEPELRHSWSNSGGQAILPLEGKEARVKSWEMKSRL